jgi:LPS-assembly lipoprotein
MNGERKEQREKRKGNVARSAVFFLPLFSLLFSLLLPACGFHLRGQGSASLPPALTTLRLSAAAYAPLTVEMRNALKGQAGVKVIEDMDAAVPTLTLYGEAIESQVQAIDITGKVSDYLLNYSVGFSLTDATGKPLLAPQFIKLQREYTFDKLNVLAKEREDEFLRHEMQRDAVQQILRRLASLARAD